MPVKYELVEHDNSFHENHWAVRIGEGDYEGVAYQYDTVSINEEEGEVVLSFNTITLDNPKELDLKSDEFESIIGDILVSIIEEQLENMNGEDGTGSTEAPTE
jgi:actin-like ATPase involved in cell morphogenesis